MNIKKRKRGVVEVHTSALNDIMFFLMLFFLLASAVANPNVVKLFLPRSSSGQSIPQKTINVSITKELEYFVEKQPVALADLYKSIEVYQRAAPDLTIILYADRTIVKLVLATETKK